jgi:hypothetical protein
MTDLDDPTALSLWLHTQTSLAVLREQFQSEWVVVEKELVEAIQAKDNKRLDQLIRPRLSQHRSTRNRRSGKQETREICIALIRQRMAILAIEDTVKSSLSGGKTETVGPVDRFLFRLLFFTGDKRRKVVSNRLFRLLWPLVRKPNLLLLEAEARGIYCFFSKDFVTELAELVKAKRCIEIAAGDGALARSLRRQGANVLASDDYSWAHKINYPDDVERLDVKDALALHSPDVVICSWPPARNDFERHVFQSNDVQRYIVIGSEHEFAFGNWGAYQANAGFSMRKAAELSALLLPREFGAAVYVFERI